MAEDKKNEKNVPATPVTPEVTSEDIQLIRNQITGLEEKVQNISESIPNVTEENILELEVDITELQESSKILEKLVTDLIGEVDILTTQFNAVDIGEYEVEEFP